LIHNFCIVKIKHVDLHNAKNNILYHNFFLWYSLYASSIKIIASRHDDDDSYSKLRITVNMNNF